MFFTNLETERLFLKNIGTDDRDFIYSEFSNDDINKYLYDAEPLTDISGADEIINFYIEPEPRFQHRWVLIKKEDNKKIGTCGFHCWDKINSKIEIGYELLKEYWGKGYMQEALEKIILFSKNLMSIKEINANIAEHNVKSIKLIEKLGFTETGTKYYLFRDKEYLHKIYTLLIK